MTELVIIHYLIAGQPACGSLHGLPRDWPAGNYWSDDMSEVSCTSCRILVKQAKAQPPD